LPSHVLSGPLVSAALLAYVPSDENVLSIPILVVHAALGHINWTVAGAFSLGAVPTSFLGGRLAQRVASSALRKTFGWFLVGSGLAFVLYRVLGA
jgi:hypothetical protein